MIPYGRQDINQQDIDAVIEVLQSDFLTQGPVVTQFENKVAEYCGAKFATAVNSGTSALHLACLALEVGERDLVWTTPITFVASANCALYCGASIDFVDIDPKTYNMSVEILTEKLEIAARIDKLPKVIIPVHFSGQSCDMASIHSLSQKYGFKIIEDASHAIGGKYSGEPIGNCRYSDITIFSFHPVKIVTTGEGGMALTNQVKLAKRMRLLSSHGVTRDVDDMTHPSDGPWYYQQIDLGFNYRMTDIHAALGLSQMQRLDKFVQQRHAIADQYSELLANLPIVTPWQHSDCYSAYHLYVIRLELDNIDMTQLEIFTALHAKGIRINLHYIPVYMQPFYTRLGFKAGCCPEAEKYYAEAISLPMFPTLTTTDMSYVSDSLRKLL